MPRAQVARPYQIQTPAETADLLDAAEADGARTLLPAPEGNRQLAPKRHCWAEIAVALGFLVEGSECDAGEFAQLGDGQMTDGLRAWLDDCGIAPWPSRQAPARSGGP